MGQKVNPVGFRLGVNRGWDSVWYAKKKDFGNYLIEDFKIREYIKKNVVNSGVSKVMIERTSNKCFVTIYTSRPGFVIGKKCRHVPYDSAANVIYGYTVVNDVTIRDWQMRGPPMTMTMGKSWDTHCPFGPYLVTSDEVGDPHNLKLETHVNGELRQSASTSDLIFDCFTLVEYLSTAFTLEPGDLIPTGTPAGSAVMTRNWLKADDEVKIEIEKLGFIKNKVIEEPEDTPVY